MNLSAKIKTRNGRKSIDDKGSDVLKTPILRTAMNAATPNPEQPSAPQLRKAVSRIRQMKDLRPFLITATLLAFVLTIAISVSAAQKLWSGAAGDTFWSSGGNWSPAGIPGASNNLTFTNDGVSDNPIVLGGALNNVVDAGF